MRSESNTFEKLRNQVLGVVITGALGWLLMSFMFMTTINNTVARIEKKQERQEERVEELTKDVLTLKALSK